MENVQILWWMRNLKKFKKSKSVARDEQEWTKGSDRENPPEHRDRWQIWKLQENRDCRSQTPRPSRQMDKLGEESTNRKIQRARRSWRSRRVSCALRQWVTWLQSCVFMKSVFVFDLEFSVVSERASYVKVAIRLSVRSARLSFRPNREDHVSSRYRSMFFSYLRVGIRTQFPFELKVCSDLSRFKN